jgi:HSP20 family protein
MATALQRWDPFAEMANMRTFMDRFFDQGLGRFAPARGGEDLGTSRLDLDVSETPTEYVIRAAVPGVDPKDVEIKVDDDVLTIRGESRHEEESKDDTYIRRELRYGSFQRQLRLPPTVEADKAQATFDKGLLKLTLPKRPESRARQITITPQGVIDGEKKETPAPAQS